MSALSVVSWCSGHQRTEALPTRPPPPIRGRRVGPTSTPDLRQAGRPDHHSRSAAGGPAPDTGKLRLPAAEISAASGLSFADARFVAAAPAIASDQKALEIEMLGGPPHVLGRGRG
ncbi:hypothetical protein [Nocardia sp. R7R-8]|uniref:hypothetical protein n=1 Tax=Nocardia sp. R7R-8 TaxID=3459304 RepID=UPI00403D820A